MPTNKISLRIVTPAAVKIDEDVNMIIMRSTTGDMGFMANHQAYSASLDCGAVRILGDEGERTIAVYGGFAIIQNNKMTITVNDAEWPDDIDRAKAEADRDRAQSSLQTETDESLKRDAQLLLKRSLVQLEVSSHSSTNN